MTELLVLRGVVGAAPDEVAEVLPDVLAGAGMTVTREGRSVTRQSEWWYRSVTSVGPDPRGCLVVQRIFDVDPEHGWAVRFAARGPLNAAPTEFAALLDSIAARLSGTAWMVED